VKLRTTAIPKKSNKSQCSKDVYGSLNKAIMEIMFVFVYKRKHGEGKEKSSTSLIPIYSIK
jgi:hypothetical protein